jgi:hypothetical protein
VSDTAVKRGPGRPPREAIKSGLLEEPYELAIMPNVMGWLITVKLPRVPVGAFRWVQDTPDLVHMLREFLPGCTLDIGYTSALDNGVVILRLTLSEYSARESLGAREASYDSLADMIRDHIARHSGELSAIAKKIRLYVGAE